MLAVAQVDVSTRFKPQKSVIPQSNSVSPFIHRFLFRNRDNFNKVKTHIFKRKEWTAKHWNFQRCYQKRISIENINWSQKRKINVSADIFFFSLLISFRKIRITVAAVEHIVNKQIREQEKSQAKFHIDCIYCSVYNSWLSMIISSFFFSWHILCS